MRNKELLQATNLTIESILHDVYIKRHVFRPVLAPLIIPKCELTVHQIGRKNHHFLFLYLECNEH